MKYFRPVLKGLGFPPMRAVNMSSKECFSKNSCSLCCWRTSSPDSRSWPTRHSRCSCPPCASNMHTARSSVGTLASFKGFNVFDCLFLINGTAFPGFPESKVGNFLSAYNKHCKSHVQAVAVDKPPPNLEAQMLQKNRQSSKFNSLRRRRN